MAAALPVITAIAGAASVVGTVVSMQNQKRSARAQQQQQEAATRHQRRQAIREAQVARAQAVASGVSAGATGSSAALGGQSSVGAQLGTQLGFGTQMSSLSRDISRYQQRAAFGSGLAQLGGTIFQATGGLDNFRQQPTTPQQAGLNPLNYRVT